MNKTEQERLLAEWRKHVLKRTPIRERIRILRKLVIDGGSPNEWRYDLADHEKELLYEIENNIENNKELENNTELANELEILNNHIEERKILDGIKRHSISYFETHSISESVTKYKNVIAELKDRKWHVCDAADLIKELKNEVIKTASNNAQKRIIQFWKEIGNYTIITADAKKNEIKKKEIFYKNTIRELKENVIYKQDKIKEQAINLHNEIQKLLHEFLIEQDKYFIDGILKGININNLKNTDRNKLNKTLRLIMNRYWKSQNNQQLLNEIENIKNKINSEIIRRDVEEENRKQLENSRRRESVERQKQTALRPKIDQFINAHTTNNVNETEKIYQELCDICNYDFEKYLKAQNWIEPDLQEKIHKAIKWKKFNSRLGTGCLVVILMFLFFLFWTACT